MTSQITSPGSLYDALYVPEEHRHVSISREQSGFIHAFILEKQLRTTLEIGLAYGVSAAHIIQATGSEHVAIDPYQHRFGDIGLKNVERVGLARHLVHLNGYSHDCLPELLKAGRRFDFAFIDGSHLYDMVFVDFYYVDLLLNQQGYVILHDTWMRSIQLICGWIETNKPDYTRRLVRADNMALFQKNGGDDRAWDHFVEFYLPPPTTEPPTPKHSAIDRLRRLLRK